MDSSTIGCRSPGCVMVRMTVRQCFGKLSITVDSSRCEFNAFYRICDLDFCNRDDNQDVVMYAVFGVASILQYLFCKGESCARRVVCF